MTIINFTGFETGDAAEGIDFQGSGATIQTTVKHKGQYSLKIDTNSSQDYYSLAMNSADGSVRDCSLTQAYIQFYFRIDTLPGTDEMIFSFHDTSDTMMGYLTIDNSGLMRLWDGTGQAIYDCFYTISTSTQYRIRLYVDNSNSCTTMIRVNDEAYGYGVGIKYGTGTIARFSFGTRQTINSQAYTAYFDDITIDDSTWGPDTFNNVDSTGPYFCVRLAPNAAGSAAGWTLGTGSTFAEVDERPSNGDTDYISNNGSSTSMFNVTNLSFGQPQSAFTIKSYGRNRYVGGGSGVLTDIRIANGGSADGTTQINPSTSYTDRCKLYLTAPGGAAWTITNINSVQIGCTNNNKINGARVTTLCVLVLGSSVPAILSPNTTPMLAAQGVGGPASTPGF